MTDLKFDFLKMLYMEPYTLKPGIDIVQPTLEDIIEYGEDRFFIMLNVFIGNPTSYRVQLWDLGIDWNKISDFELFSDLAKGLPIESTKIIIPGVNFKEFVSYVRPIPDAEDKEMYLYNPIQDIEITEQDYACMASYLRNMFDIFPKVEKARGKFTKQSIIEEDKMNLLQKKAEKHDSILFPLISSCLNHPGFKYNLDELKHMGIFQFMDAVKRLRVYEETNALLHGAYGGMIDSSKLDKKLLDFMRDC